MVVHSSASISAGPVVKKEELANPSSSLTMRVKMNKQY
jgi:hypothetical protein